MKIPTIVYILYIIAVIALVIYFNRSKLKLVLTKIKVSTKKNIKNYKFEYDIPWNTIIKILTFAILLIIPIFILSSIVTEVNNTVIEDNSIRNTSIEEYQVLSESINLMSKIPFWGLLALAPIIFLKILGDSNKGYL